MSQFSGKCDVYDTLVMIHNYTDEELKNNVRIYMNGELLDIESRKDLIPYYPHLICSGSFDARSRTSVVHITSYSYVDFQEKEILNHYKDVFIKTKKYCDKKGIPFDEWDTLQKVSFGKYERKVYSMLYKRVKEVGKNAKVDDLHLSCYEMYRQFLVDEMIENGLNPADYGYGRFVPEKENKE